jgi:uncharacterized protein YbjT (DUF2867 family)
MAPSVPVSERPIDPVLVLGATGTHGGAVARGLLASGSTVRALVRDPGSARALALADAGATLVTGDLLDRRSLASAFSDVGAAYAITTPFAGGADDEVRQGEAIIAAAADASLGWLILASVAAADRAPVPHFQSKARVERRLAQTDLPWTVVAPSYFYENVLGSLAAIREGCLPIALPADKPLHQVALADLGSVVAAILTRRDEHLQRRIEVAGDAPTPAAMAAAFGVQYEEVSLEEILERSADLGSMYGFLAQDGYAIDVAAVRERYPEVAWRSFAEWARTVDRT